MAGIAGGGFIPPFYFYFFNLPPESQDGIGPYGVGATRFLESSDDYFPQRKGHPTGLIR